MILKVVAKKSLKDELGQSLVQFAILLPVLITFLFLIIDCYRIVKTYMIVDSAAMDCAKTVVEKNYSTYNEVIEEILYKESTWKRNNSYETRLVLKKISYNVSVVGGVKKENYIYRPMKGLNYPSQFQYHDIKIELKYKLKMITPISALIFGNEIEIHSSYITRIGGSKIRY